MTPRQKVFALTVGIAIFGIIITLVHRRRLREEYAWIWLATGAGIMVLAAWYDLLLWITALIGAVLPTTTLFIFGLLFLVFITLHYSLKISQLSGQVRSLAQQVALLKAENEEMQPAKRPQAPDAGMQPKP